MRTFSILLLLLLSWSVQSQTKIESVSISLFSHSFFYPSYHILQGPFHPGVAFGITSDEVSGKRTDKSWSLTTGFYHHRYFENGLFLNLARNYSFSVGNSLDLTLSPTLGYLHTTSPTKTYKWTGDGYERTSGHRANVNLGGTVSLTYNKWKIQPFTRVSILAYGPFASGWGIPAAPKTLIEFGAKFNLPGS